MGVFTLKFYRLFGFYCTYCNEAWAYSLQDHIAWPSQTGIFDRLDFMCKPDIHLKPSSSSSPL